MIFSFLASSRYSFMSIQFDESRFYPSRSTTFRGMRESGIVSICGFALWVYRDSEVGEEGEKKNKNKKILLIL